MLFNNEEIFPLLWFNESKVANFNTNFIMNLKKKRLFLAKIRRITKVDSIKSNDEFHKLFKNLWWKTLSPWTQSLKIRTAFCNFSNAKTNIYILVLFERIFRCINSFVSQDRMLKTLKFWLYLDLRNWNFRKFAFFKNRKTSF